MPGLPFVLIAILLLQGVLVLTLGILRPRSLLRRWAKDNEYEILRSKRCRSLLQSFVFAGLGEQIVYRVVIRSPDDQIRQGMIRVGGLFWGTLVYQIKERWDEGS